MRRLPQFSQSEGILTFIFHLYGVVKLSITVKSELMAQPILKIENIAKVFPGAVQALFPINLSIEQGEIFALLGPNAPPAILATVGKVNPGLGPFVFRLVLHRN